MVHGLHIVRLFLHFIRLKFTYFYTELLILLQAFLRVFLLPVKGYKLNYWRQDPQCGYFAKWNFFGAFIARAYL